MVKMRWRVQIHAEGAYIAPYAPSGANWEVTGREEKGERQASRVWERDTNR